MTHLYAVFEEVSGYADRFFRRDEVAKASMKHEAGLNQTSSLQVPGGGAQQSRSASPSTNSQLSALRLRSSEYPLRQFVSPQRSPVGSQLRSNVSNVPPPVQRWASSAASNFSGHANIGTQEPHARVALALRQDRGGGEKGRGRPRSSSQPLQRDRSRSSRSSRRDGRRARSSKR